MRLQVVKRNWNAENAVHYIVFLGDFHLGNPSCNVDLLKRHISEIPKSAVVFLIGDLAEFINYDDKRFEAESIDSRFWCDLDRLPQAYVDYLEDLLYPIREQVVCVHDGNHEAKLSPSYQPGYELCRRLDLLDRYVGLHEAYTNIRFRHESGGKGRSILVNTHHGWQGGRMAGAKHNEMVKALAWVAGDIVVRGHSHELFADPAPLMVEPNRGHTHLVYRKRWVGHSGSYFTSRTLDSASYAEVKQYPPLPLGHIRFRVEMGDTTTTGGTGYDIHSEVVT